MSLESKIVPGGGGVSKKNECNHVHTMKISGKPKACNVSCFSPFIGKIILPLSRVNPRHRK